MKKVEQPRKPMLIYAFCVLILLLLVNLLLMPAITGQALQSVDYSTFLNMVKEGEVSKAQIETDYIYFEDKEEPVNIYRTATFNDPELVNRLDEANFTDIARIMQLGEGQVRVYLHRARGRIKRLIEETENYGL